jgi:hypothetical protein
MHWNAAVGRDHEALRRLAVVLLTLAAIADSIARRSGPFSGIVLWLLGKAEVRARDLAFNSGAFALVSNPGGFPVCLSGGSGEAARLAQSFQALAVVFFALSRQARQWLRMARRYDPVRAIANRPNLVEPGRSSARHLPFTDTS